MIKSYSPKLRIQDSTTVLYDLLPSWYYISFTWLQNKPNNRVKVGYLILYFIVDIIKLEEYASCQVQVDHAIAQCPYPLTQVAIIYILKESQTFLFAKDKI